MPLAAIEPRRLYRQVADQLRQLIDRGEYPVGGRLPTERELAEQLGVSRPTVREALIALEVEGRLKIRVGSGIYVVEPPAAAAAPAGPAPIEGPFELLRARQFVESAIAAEAARVAGPEDVARLDAILAEMDRGGGKEELIAMDRAFHTTITAMLDNAVLVRFVGELFDQRINPYFEQLALYFENEATWRAATAEHRAVRDAIAAQDPEGASAAMRHHLERSQERLSSSFGDGAGERGRPARKIAGPPRNGRPARIDHD
ncbi:FadR/GntR family transcriptional regulator [Prosthecomicrobium sp. N25]|uniref:FadR/GntR family transcriptional regulator n=1 Tax=Prosthecomicrobium sp. N25 TaxID=3129254 RepID=UPI003077C90F